MRANFICSTSATECDPAAGSFRGRARVRRWRLLAANRPVSNRPWLSPSAERRGTTKGELGPAAELVSLVASRRAPASSM